MDYSKYLILDNQFLIGEIDGVEFSKLFVDLYLNDQTHHRDETFNVHETLFYYVDSYEPLPELREQLDIQVDDKDLLWAVREHFVSLKNLRNP